MTRMLAGALCLIVIAGCTSAPMPSSSPGTQIISRNSVLFQGPELAATVSYLQGKDSVAEEWLVLAVELTNPRGAGPIDLDHDAISLRTPDGRRLDLVDKQVYFRNYARLQIPVERAMAFLPVLHLYQPSRQPCDRWFFEVDPGRMGFEVLNLSSARTCSGPLAFHVPGGVQPGRWRLVFDLEESRPDIPFVIEIDN